MNKLLAKNTEYYKSQMEIGNVPQTYKGLVEYMMSLRTYFKNRYPDYKIGSFYQGYMDMTYFPIITALLREKNMKLAVVLNHYKLIFEIWLSAQNRGVIKNNQELFKQAGLNNKNTFTSNPDSIVEVVIIKNPDFNHLKEITNEIVSGVEVFLIDLEYVLK